MEINPQFKEYLIEKNVDVDVDLSLSIIDQKIKDFVKENNGDEKILEMKIPVTSDFVKAFSISIINEYIKQTRNLSK